MKNLKTIQEGFYRNTNSGVTSQLSMIHKKYFGEDSRFKISTNTDTINIKIKNKSKKEYVSNREGMYRMDLHKKSKISIDVLREFDFYDKDGKYTSDSDKVYYYSLKEDSINYFKEYKFNLWRGAQITHIEIPERYMLFDRWTIISDTALKNVKSIYIHGWGEMKSCMDMCQDLKHLQYIHLPDNWGGVDNCMGMFCRCTKLNYVELPKSFGKVKDTRYMFLQSGVSVLDLEGVDMSGVGRYTSMIGVTGYGGEVLYIMLPDKIQENSQSLLQYALEFGSRNVSYVKIKYKGVWFDVTGED